MPDVVIRPFTDADHEWVKQFIMQRWGSPIMIGHGVTYTISELPGFVADVEGEDKPRLHAILTSSHHHTVHTTYVSSLFRRRVPAIAHNTDRRDAYEHQ